MSCWVYEGQKDSKAHSLVSHPWEWKPGCPLYPEVATSIDPWPLTPYLPWDLQICWKIEKKSGKGNKEDLYWEWCSWTAGASSVRNHFYFHMDIKSCERNFISQRGWDVVWYMARLFIWRGRSCQRFLENILRRSLRDVSKNTFTDDVEDSGAWIGSGSEVWWHFIQRAWLCCIIHNSTLTFEQTAFPDMC